MTSLTLAADACERAAELMRDIAEAPFAPGDRVVSIRNPRGGVLVVQRCKRHPQGGWYLHAGGGGYVEGAGAEHYVRVPADWRDAPELPLSEREWAQLGTDGPLDPAVLAAADERDRSPEARRRMADAYLALASWWTRYGAMIAPERAVREAALYRRLAEQTERE